MISLINRIAWIVSLLVGIFFLIVITLFLDWRLYEWDAMFLLFLWTIIGFIFKRIFLWRNFIQERVVEYSGKLVAQAWWKWIVSEQKLSTYNPEPEQSFNLAEEEEDEPVEENVIADNKTYSYAQERVQEEKTEYIQKQTEPAEPNFLEKFFAENALAKIGGILLFLGVLFFLSLIYTAAGPVSKVIIWFATGFIFFWTGVVLDRKWYTNESRTMLWVGILVNYLVILSGRYLVWVQMWEGNWVLTEGTTFLFLILNTVFAIVTSLVYKSKTLLLFSFIFAYLNPFLIGSKWDGTPYTLVGYSAIVSFGALILSQLYYNGRDEDFGKYLSMVGFIWWNVLFLLAPFTTASQWLVKLMFIWIVSLSTIILAYKNDDRENIWWFFIGVYIAFWILLITGWTANVLHTGLAFLGYIAFIGMALAMSVFMMVAGSIVSLGYLLFAPLILIFWLLVTGSLFMVVPVILGSLLVYLVIFSFLYEVVSTWFKYLFFVGLCIFLVLSNVTLQFIIPESMDNITHLSVVISSLIFLFAAYYFSGKEKLEYLYTIGTIGTIFLLLPIIATGWEFMKTSIIAIGVFALANILTPFINRNLCQKDLKNLALSLVAGIVFIGWELYNFWEMAKLFPWVSLGYAFMWLAALYFVLGYVMTNILDIELSPTSLTSSNNEDKKNTIFGYLGVSISLFSIAILIMFSDRPAIVASIWFFEATILFFFFSRIKDMKIFLGALVLFVVWLFRYGTFIWSLQTWVYEQLLPLAAIFTSFILNLKFLEKTEDETKLVHDILHFIAMIMVGIWVLKIVPHTWQGFSILALSVVFVIVGFCYNIFASKTLQYAFATVICIFYLHHISALGGIYDVLESENKTQLKYLQYLAVAIPGTWLYFRSLFGSRFDPIKKIINIPYIVYVFIITTQFVYDLSDNNTFSITIYWSLWAFAYISNGINNEKQVRRTIGLYILTWVILKILCYDVWFGIDDAILRVVALMFVGGLMVYISTLYSRKYSGSLLGEFNLGNLTDNSQDTTTQNSVAAEGKGFKINEKISQVDIGDITAVTFKVNSGKTYKVKSKNLIKIAKLVAKNTGKTEFWKNELKDIYAYIVKNYQSELNPADYKKIVVAMEEFVEQWGGIFFE